MRIGVDGRKIPESAKRGPIGSLAHGKELGMEGLFFRTVLDMSPSLDKGLLQAIRDCADELGMYLETGLGKVNPYATPEAPELRAIGDGDIVRGFRRMMEACAAIDCRELWVATANYKPSFRGRRAYDRFRTDVSVLYPFGQGQIDWQAILAMVPEAPRWIETHRGRFAMPVFDREWLAAQPDMPLSEFAAVMAMAARAGSGPIPWDQAVPLTRLASTLEAVLRLDS